MRRLALFLSLVLAIASCTRTRVVTVPSPAPITLEAGCDTVTQWIRRDWRRRAFTDTIYAELHVCPRVAPPDAPRPKPIIRAAG